ncbi:MAG: prolipoprotein diacylglyceryl transferase [Acidimicrobiales bacterium]
MRPIPVAFHIWFLEVHTYGIGLALTFWFGLRYTERRLRRSGYPWQWVTAMFVWVIVAAIVGARAMHVLANLSYYTHNPAQVIAIWQGGLSSFGGLLLGVPTAIVITRRRCPELSILRFADLMAPVLMACWGIGRLLGPQLMVAGGGHRTNQWFGMYYAGQVGKRLPVPLFQAAEDLSIFVILLLVERWLRSTEPILLGGDRSDKFDAPETGDRDDLALRAVSDRTGHSSSGVEIPEIDGADAGHQVERADLRPSPHEEFADLRGANPPPAGIVLGVGMVLWGIERFSDQHLWLAEPGHLGSFLVQLAGIGLSLAGIALLLTRLGPLMRWRRGDRDRIVPPPSKPDRPPEVDKPPSSAPVHTSGSRSPLSRQSDT